MGFKKSERNRNGLLLCPRSASGLFQITHIMSYLTQKKRIAHFSSFTHDRIISLPRAVVKFHAVFRGALPVDRQAVPL